MDEYKTENSEWKRVSVHLSKCDNLIKKCDEFQSHNNAVTRALHLQSSRANKDGSSSKNHTPSKIMSISELFNVMITNAQNVEPKQFSLPAEYLENVNLNVPRKRSELYHPINETDSNDMMKLPLRKCYYCKKICSDGEIVSCDFCPAHFHINCLDPPLCCTPDVKWMCPLHPHHFLNKIMARSYSITELTLWWNKMDTSSNDESVENDFIQKIRSLKKNQPPKRVTTSHTAKIPEIIKYHYGHCSTPPSVLRELTNPRQYRIFRNSSFTVPREIISRAKHRRTENEWSESNTCINHRKDFDSTSTTLIEIISDNSPKPWWREKSPSENLSLWDPVHKRFTFTSHGIYDYDRLGSNLKTSACKENNSGNTQTMRNSLSTRTNETSDMNQKNCSWSRVQQIINYDIQNSFDREKGTQNEMDHSAILRKRLNERKLHSMIRSYPPSFIPNTLPYPLHSSSVYETFHLPNKPVRKVHAVLCPLSHEASPVYMYHNTLKVGTDIRNDVYLVKYGTCEFLSDHHATIFYDEFTNTYELLNYSEYYCVVDGLCYTNNLSRESSKTEVFHWKSYSTEMNISLNKDSGKKILPAMLTNGIKKRPKRHSQTPFTVNTKNNKRFHSKNTPREREWRHTQQKLMQEIEKLVTKSQKEMSSIANEDLNEIAKVLKNRKSSAVTSNKIEEAQQSSRAVFIIKRKRKRKLLSNQMSRFFSKNKRRNAMKRNAQKSPPSENQPSEVKEAAPVKSSAVRRPACHAASVPEGSTRLTKKESMKSISVNGSDDGVGHPENQATDHYQVKPIEGIEEKCRCRTQEFIFPIGRDSSWEISAPLHHGSHIRIGCIEFVFCIVNCSTTSEERSNDAKEKVPTAKGYDERSQMGLRQGESRRQTKDSDLSSKLTSILTVLTSDSEVRDESSSLTLSLPLSIDGKAEEDSVDSASRHSDQSNEIARKRRRSE